MLVVNATNRSITYIEGPPNTEEGSLPASKASIEAMSMVKVLDEGIDCTIYLSNFGIGEEAKEMPCKHHFHLICIDKWLGINGSCPICRYKMPVDEECENQRREDEREDDGGSEMEGDRVMLVFHVIIRRDTNFDSSIPSISVSELEVYRHSDDVMIGAGDGDLLVRRQMMGVGYGDELEARVGDEAEAGGDESEAQAMVIDNN